MLIHIAAGDGKPGIRCCSV